MLASPAAVVPATRMVLAPALRGTATDTLAQVSQLAVVGKFSVPCAAPLTEMVAGRAEVVPSEYRKLRVLVPAAAAVTGMSTYAPTALAVFAKPVPVKPAWLESKVPPADRVPVSASNTLPFGGGVPPAMAAPRLSRACWTLAWALAFRLALVPFTTQDGPENITTVTPLSTPPVVPLLGMPSSWAALTEASPSSRESLSEVVWLFAVCVSPKIEPMTLPLKNIRANCRPLMLCSLKKKCGQGFFLSK